MVEQGNWDRLLQRKKFNLVNFYVPSGTIHALCEGTLVLETQQSSDTTYRVYDYDRVDSDGNKRELHVEKSITVSMILMRIMKFILKLKKKMALLLLNMYKKVFFSL